MAGGNRERIRGCNHVVARGDRPLRRPARRQLRRLMLRLGEEGPVVAVPLPEPTPGVPDGAPTPYRGYYYRVLPRQGKGSLGGPKDYVLNG